MKDGMTNDERTWCIHLPNDLRRPTKLQALVEDRQMYRLIEDALRAYLKKHAAK